MASEHADKLKVERVFMESFGCTRSQARQALQRAAGQASLERQSRQAQEQQVEAIARKDRTKIEVTEVKTQVAPFLAPPAAMTPVAQPGGGGVLSGTVRALLVVQSDDDPPTYSAVAYDIKGDVVS